MTRLDPGAKLYISPMLNATSMALFTSASGDGAKSPSVLDSMPSSATGSECLQPHSQAFPSLIPRPSQPHSHSFPRPPQLHSHSFPGLIPRPSLVPVFDHICDSIPLCVLGLSCTVCTCVSIFCFLVPHLPALRSTDDRRGTMDKTSVSGLELTSIKSIHSKAPAPPSRCVIVWFPGQVAWE